MRISSLFLSFVFVSLSLFGQSNMPLVSHMDRFSPELQQTIESLSLMAREIAPERQAILQEIAAEVVRQRREGEEIKMVFICTHNSRRSHLGQIWAAAMVEWFGLKGISTFSGGTEATAFNPRAVAALRRAGFSILDEPGTNPHYKVGPMLGYYPWQCFSKRFDDNGNPQADFMAIMTCSDADQACPIVPGASFRIGLTYLDPKIADGTVEEQLTYDERCKQIGSEMYFLFSQLASSLE